MSGVAAYAARPYIRLVYQRGTALQVYQVSYMPPPVPYMLAQAIYLTTSPHLTRKLPPPKSTAPR